jgi:hypothetical protein
MTGHSPDGHPSKGGGHGGWIFLGFLLIAGYFLWTEHRAHFIEFLPFVLLLACPLLHLFHRHSEHGSEKDKKP